jgi:hypothetical protein
MSAAAFTQLCSATFPGGYGVAIAVVRSEPEEFSRNFALTFMAGEDNLDYYKAAMLRLTSGRTVMLLRHERAPAPGTEIHADVEDDFVAALREFLEAFDLSADDLTWMRDDIPAEQLRPAEARAGA